MKKTVIQNIANTDAGYVYEANLAYGANEAFQVFRDNIRKRKDLSDSFKSKALDAPSKKQYEIVYYPAHIYQTDTTKTWNTTSRSSSTSSYDGFDVKTTTTTTTQHTRGGYKKVSEAKFKKSCDYLEIEKFDLNQTTQVSRNISVNMYSKDLFFDRKENGANAVSAGRKASNAKKGDSTFTEWTLHVVLIPVFRFNFEVDGKKCFFEMNLHNGEFITHYKQKGGCAFATAVLRMAHIILSVALFLVPLLALVFGFKAGFANVGFIKKVLSVIVLLACLILGFCLGIFGLMTNAVQYEKIFYKTSDQIITLYVTPLIFFAIILVLTLVFKGMGFN